MTEEEKFRPSETTETKERSLNFQELMRQATSSQIEKSLKTKKDLVAFEEWRGLDNDGREARQLRKMVEHLTAAISILEKHPEQQQEISQKLLDFLNLNKNISLRTRVEQFQALLAAEVLGLDKPGTRKEVERLFEGLKKLKSTEGELNAIELLTSGKVGFDLKKDWLESHFLPRLDFLARKDLEEAKNIPPSPEVKPPVEGKPPTMPELPPEEQDFVRPSIDEMEKQEGEPTGYFTVTPFYGGYWKEKTFEEWDPRNLCFRAGLRKIKEVEIKKTDEKTDEKTERVMHVKIKAGAKTTLPCAYNFTFKPETLKLSVGQEIKILEDQEGNYLLESAKGEGVNSFTISLGKIKKEKESETEKAPQVLEMETGELSQETEKFLRELKQDASLSSVDKARRLKQYVRNLLEYPGKGDSSYNAIYYQEPAKFFQKIEQHKKADCDVANTFYLALLARLEIPARLATGHYIKVKDHQGRAVFSSGTRHAWAEVWDSDWHRLDATPKGAPELDEEEMDEKEEDEYFEGDFGETEAKILSDEEVKEMIEMAKKEQSQKKEREKNPEEIRELNFAKEAGCNQEEAKKILMQIEKARQLKDSKGRNILDLFSREFMKIIKENLKEILSYRAPVRLPEADELEEPVEAYIDIESGEAEPGGFKKYEKKILKVQEYGGFDLILICDKSGSMAESDPVTGEEKWREQQKFAYLVTEAIHKFSDYCKKYQVKLLNPIDVRTCLITFQAGGHKVVLPLSDVWGPKEQYQVWQKLAENIGGGTPDHLGLAAAKKMILEDIEKQKGRKKEEAKKRLRLVVVTADGGSDDKIAVQSALADLRGQNIVVEAAGLTEAAKEIEATYYPNAQCLESVRQAPEWVAERIIQQVKKLYPRKIKQ